MRIYGLKTGRNNMVGRTARSYMYYSKNYNTYNKNKEKSDISVCEYVICGIFFFCISMMFN